MNGPLTREAAAILWGVTPKEIDRALEVDRDVLVLADPLSLDAAWADVQMSLPERKQLCEIEFHGLDGSDIECLAGVYDGDVLEYIVTGAGNSLADSLAAMAAELRTHS